jgi:hypothetical protein
VLHDWCLAGYGIAWRSTWEVEAEIAAGRLVAVLDEFAAPPNGIYVVFPQRKHLPLRVRLWIDFLKHHYSPVKSADALCQTRIARRAGRRAGKLSPGAGAKAAFESPKVAAHGDFACTAAMQLAKPLKLNPRQVAEQLRTALLATPAFTSAGWRTSTSPAPASSTSA